MATSVRSKMTEMFIVKMLEGQYSIVVKLFTTIVRVYSGIWWEYVIWYAWGTLEKILGIVSRKFPGIESEELFSGNSQEFPQILSTFSPVFCRIVNKKFPMDMVTRKSLELVTRNSMDRVMKN